MPINKNAFLRYRIIDRCLTNTLTPYLSKKEIIEKIKDVLGESISPSQFDKDIAAMRHEFNAPIAFHNVQKGYYYSDTGFSLNKFPLTPEEITALDFSTAVLQTLKHSDLFEQFEGAIDKVISGYRVGRILGKSDGEIIQVEAPLEDAGAKWIEVLYKAIIEKQTLRINYQPFGKEVKQHIYSPYLLKEYRNRWYIAGYSARAKNAIVLALDRIQYVESAAEAYFNDPGFNGKEYFKYSFGVTHRYTENPGKVTLSFTPKQAKYILSQPLHHSQKLILDSPEEVQVEIEVYITQDLMMAILSYGDGVKVLQPQSLIDNIKETIDRMKALYD
jgi:predicted DNA-binding transcriptional regulator YafY